MEDLLYREAKDGDFEEIGEICTAENWAAGPEYIKELCHGLSTDYMPVVRSGGKVVAFCIGVPLNDDEAFIALLVVTSDFKRRGIGTQLVKKCVAALGKRNITLYSTMEAVNLYRNCGFKSGSNPSYLYQPTFQPKRGTLRDIKLLAGFENVHIVPLSKVSLKTLVDYDTGVHRLPRERQVKKLVTSKPESLAALNEAGDIVGYAGVGIQGIHTRVQPIHADSPEVAELLLSHIVEEIPTDGFIKLKVPSDNPDAVSLMERIGFCPTDQVQAYPHLVMYTRHRFQVEISKVFSLMDDVRDFA